MLRQQNSRVNKSFNDGICTFYTIEKRTLKNKVCTFYYCEETLGIKVFTELQVVGAKAEKVISIPYNTLVTSTHVVVINDIVYNVELIQVKDTFPKSLKITLSRSPFEWLNTAN